MKFEVTDVKGNILFVTEHKDCLPTDDELKSMRTVNYRYRVDGKFVDKEKILKIVKELRES